MFENIQPVTISARAAAEIRKIMQTKNIPTEYGLRVGIKGGGCGGASLLLGFDKLKETDIAHQIDGIPVYVDKRHTMYIIGKEIDFLDTSEARGFTFRDPGSAVNEDEKD